MREVTPFKTPPVAPIDAPLEGRTHPVPHHGRNTSTALMGKFIGQD